ncbi:MAG: peptide chain release factor 2 [bacterium]|nr:peptide chain release factor 2 [bacterium]
MQAEFDALQARQSEPGFWQDRAAAEQVTRRLRVLKSWLEPVAAAASSVADLGVLAELAQQEDDEGVAGEVREGVAELVRQLDRLESQFLLSGPDDARGALLEIHPGAGGTESQDWAEMLLRMYRRYLERNKLGFEVLDLQAGDEAGIKSAILEIKSEFAYGYLKSESGVHRLVRISPFDAQSRRHTSFASVFVFPLIEDEVEVEINEQDLRIDTFRASGAGGQHVNKTDSAVRMTHLPTGLVVQCQSERSQLRNRESALTMMRAKLYMRKLEEERQKRAAIEDEKMEIAWGSQIRSYVLQPYTKVKDHRTEQETGNAVGVLDGDLEPFIDAYLRQTSRAAR